MDETTAENLRALLRAEADRFALQARLLIGSGSHYSASWCDFIAEHLEAVAEWQIGEDFDVTRFSRHESV
jgi:hypothetical protein